MPLIDLAPLSGRYLSFAEREEVAILIAQGAGVRQIARRLGRDPSTISRELRRNAATRGGKLEYRASVAQWKAEVLAQRPKTAKLIANQRLRDYVQDRLAGVVRGPDGAAYLGPEVPAWKGRNKPHRQDRRWVAHPAGAVEQHAGLAEAHREATLQVTITDETADNLTTATKTRSGTKAHERADLLGAPGAPAPRQCSGSGHRRQVSHDIGDTCLG